MNPYKIYTLYYGKRDATTDTFTQQVTRADFIHDVVEAGEIESSENVEVRCEVTVRRFLNDA